MAASLPDLERASTPPPESLETDLPEEKLFNIQLTVIGLNMLYLQYKDKLKDQTNTIITDFVNYADTILKEYADYFEKPETKAIDEYNDYEIPRLDLLNVLITNNGNVDETEIKKINDKFPKGEPTGTENKKYMGNILNIIFKLLKCSESVSGNLNNKMKKVVDGKLEDSYLILVQAIQEACQTKYNSADIEIKNLFVHLLKPGSKEGEEEEKEKEKEKEEEKKEEEEGKLPTLKYEDDKNMVILTKSDGSGPIILEIDKCYTYKKFPTTPLALTIQIKKFIEDDKGNLTQINYSTRVPAFKSSYAWSTNIFNVTDPNHTEQINSIAGPLDDKDCLKYIPTK